MNYAIWLLVGVVVALVLGAGPLRRGARPAGNAAAFAGSFGGLIGGVLGDGVPHALAGDITLISLLGAAVGGAIFCWAVRSRTEDVER